MARRQPNGRPSIYLGRDGLYHCWPTIGRYVNGRPKRKHIKRATQDEVVSALAELDERVKLGHDVTVKTETYGEWLDHWLGNIVMRQVRAGKRSQNTFDDYESISRVHLKPNLGRYRLVGRKDRLEPEHHEELYAQLAERGLSATYIYRVHAVARRSQRMAYRRGKADRVVAELVDPPENVKTPVKALKLHEAQAVLSEAIADHDGLAARWLLGILLGPRGGEACGFKWADVVLDPDPGDVPHIKPDKQIQRFKWRHGCADPAGCVLERKACRIRRCPPVYEHGCGEPGRCSKLAHHCPAKVAVPGRCSRHTRLGYCAPCPTGCTAHASTCPQRRDGGVREVDLKTPSSSEPMALPELLVEMLRTHRQRQIRVFASAGVDWTPQAHLFVGKRFKPIDGKRDWDNWQALLARAGVKRHRLHAARHTTGTFLRATGHDMKTIKEVLRHADPKVSDVYTEEGMAAKREAVERVAALLVDGDLTKIMGARRVALQ